MRWTYLQNGGYSIQVSIVNALWTVYAIQQYRTCSTVILVIMACCLATHSHYLHQCWFIITDVVWHSSENKFTSNARDTNHLPPKLQHHLPGPMSRQPMPKVRSPWQVVWSVSLMINDSKPPINTDLAPVPLSIFRSNSKFDENSERSSFEYTRPITTIFCTRHDSVTVVTCAKYRCYRPRIFYTKVFWIFIEFRIRSKYA